MKIGIIIPASGLGKRFGRIYKPLLKIKDKTFIEIIVEKFLQVDNIKKIVIAVNEKYVDKVKGITLFRPNKISPEKNLIQIIKGGEERKFSVYKAFRELCVDKSIEIVVIHDAVRPIVDLKLVNAMLKKIKSCDAIIPVKPISETVKIVENHYASKTVDRSKLCLSLTPQIFKRKAMEYAYNKVDLTSHAITDEAQLLELAGKKIKIIKYTGYNIKVTYPEDYEMVKLIMNYIDTSSERYNLYGSN
jgi:2-C-methyl-D-erythritol 4-phosphate cytidylyltransferase